MRQHEHRHSVSPSHEVRRGGCIYSKEMKGNVNSNGIIYIKRRIPGQYHKKRELLETTSTHSMECECDVCVCTLYL